MIEAEQKEKIKNHIACEEQGYPQSEARFSSVKEWEDFHKKNWYKSDSDANKV